MSDTRREPTEQEIREAVSEANERVASLTRLGYDKAYPAFREAEEVQRHWQRKLDAIENAEARRAELDAMPVADLVKSIPRGGR